MSDERAGERDCGIEPVFRISTAANEGELTVLFLSAQTR